MLPHQQRKRRRDRWIWCGWRPPSSLPRNSVSPAFLSGYGWTVHYAQDPTGGIFESSPYFLTAFGFILVAWGVGWARAWTIPVGVIMVLVVGFVLCRGILGYQSGLPGLDAMLRAIVGLMQLVFCLVALLTQAASVLIVLRRLGWTFWRSVSWRQGALEVAELIVAAAIVPVVHHYDFAVPARLQAQQDSSLAAEMAESREAVAQIEQEERERKAEVQAAVDDFIAAVLSGDEDARLAAEHKMAEIKGRVFYGDFDDILNHPDRTVLPAFIAFAQANNVSAGMIQEKLREAAADRGQDVATRRLALDCLLRPFTDYRGLTAYYIGPDDTAAIPLIQEMLADDEDFAASAEMKIRGIEALGRFAGIDGAQRQAPGMIAELNRLARNAEDEAVRMAALEAAARISRGQDQ